MWGILGMKIKLAIDAYTVNADVPDLVLCMENSVENTNYQVVLSGFSRKFFSMFFAVPRDDILPIFLCPKSVIYCWGEKRQK